MAQYGMNPILSSPTEADWGARRKSLAVGR